MPTTPTTPTAGVREPTNGQQTPGNGHVGHLVPTCPIPDALFLPPSFRVGRTRFERVHAVSRIAEPLLEVNYAAGERAWIRKMHDNWMFITKSMEDTIYMVDDSGMPGKSRYEWINRGDGIRFGYLTDAARDWEEQKKEEAAEGPAFKY